MNTVQDRYSPALPAFGAWLLSQKSKAGFIGALATAAAADRSFPKNGDAEAVRTRLRQMQADGEMFDAVDDAEADWKALADA